MGLCLLPKYPITVKADKRKKVMPHTRKTLKLSAEWDLVLDANGHIALAENGQATAQNVANECRLFTNDAYFDAERGIPYFLIALGQKLSVSVLKSRLRKAALLVDDVATVTSIQIDTFDTEKRLVTGDIQFTSKTDGSNGTVTI